jgi:outer membrane scaffolding protein for murein synthesis (MipA/OmpV family)
MLLNNLMIKPVFITLMFACCASPVLAENYPLRLGLGILEQSGVFIQADKTTSVVPVLRYESPELSIKGPRVDWKLLREGPWLLGLGLNIDASYLDRNDSSALAQWPDLSARLNAHAFTRLHLSDSSSIRLAYSHDISGESDAATAEIHVERIFPVMGLLITPCAGVRWGDEQTFEYLFETDHPTVSTDFFEPFVGIDLILPITTRLTLMSAINWYRMDTKVSDLQVVAEDTRYSLLLSLVYQVN